VKYEAKTQSVSTSMAGDPSSKVVSMSKAPDPEVSEKKPRRRFTAAYKVRILKEYDACTEPGEIELRSWTASYVLLKRSNYLLLTLP
jgi:hypothetical protein